MWRPTLVSLVLLASLGGVLVFRLGDLTPGASASEVQLIESSSSISKILEQPLHILQKLSVFGLSRIDYGNLSTFRLINAIVGFLLVIAFFLILRQWYTTRVSLLTTVLFASSSWFLRTVRIIDGDINYLLPIFLILGGTWLRGKRHFTAAILLITLTSLLLLYVPGMVWLIVPGAIWQRKSITKALASVSLVGKGLLVAALLCGLLPIIWSLSIHPWQITGWLGLPDSWPEPIAFFKNLLSVPMELFIRRQPDYTEALGQLPYLDVFTGAMVFFGVYANAVKFKLDRTKLILIAMVVGSVLAAMSGPVNIAVIMPYVYFLAAGGIAMLLQQWFTIFPRNPLARYIGLAVMLAAIGLTGYYHFNNYFVAWPNTPETENAFNEQL